MLFSIINYSSGFYVAEIENLTDDKISENKCHVEDIASSHACNPAFTSVLSTHRIPLCRDRGG